ncbi:hypothetical protein, partial [Arthrobacter sedimenti]|uniref:hypothetical protein n=1 Tax=Arthrobacter sedimenti TaxID=2694931 RepID=UPI001CDB4C8D
MARSVALATAPWPSSSRNSLRSSGAPSKSSSGEIMAARQGACVIEWSPFCLAASYVTAGKVRGCAGGADGPVGKVPS